METIPCDFPCEINGILQSCIDLTKRNNKKDIEFVFNPTSQMLMIMNDANRLMQIIGQLLRNAIRFTNQGNIIVDYQINEIKQTLQISVSDTGPGIPIEKQEEVFERFYKLNEFTQGTGLGLSIARTISEKMGGTLNIDKYYTSGSRFILTLPLIYPKPERNI
jgi:signal transduction histidine kinase